MHFASWALKVVRPVLQATLAASLSVTASMLTAACAFGGAAPVVESPCSLGTSGHCGDTRRYVQNDATLTETFATAPASESTPIDHLGLSHAPFAAKSAQDSSELSAVLGAATASPYPTSALVPVPGDVPVLVTFARPGVKRAIVYLHGRCSGVHSVDAWAQMAAHYGTVIALRGERGCAHGYYWGYSIAHLHRRIQAALKAVAEARDGDFDSSKVTLVGYSEGASRAEVLPFWYPSSYPWVVLAGAPSAPKTWWLQSARAVVLIGGEYERTDHLRRGQQRLLSAGRLAAYMEFPRTHHGSFGPEGGRIMADALWWMYDRAP